MTQINFPVATEDGQTFNAPNGVVYTYVGTPPNGYWSGTFQNEGFTTLDGRYLKLDSTNDPVIGGLNITNGPVGIGTTTTAQGALLDITGTEGRILVRTDQNDECIDSVNLANSAFSPLRIRGTDVSIQNGSTTNLIVKENGNVGIGSISPSEKLVLANVAASSGFSDTAISMIRSNYGGRFAGYIDQGVGHGITIDTINNATPTERMRITGDGNVGIGTESPDARLEIETAGSDYFPAIELTNTAGTGSAIRSKRGLSLEADYVANSGQQESEIVFKTDNIQRMVIDYLGRVGISSPTPDMLLKVGEDTASGCVRIGKTRAYMLAGQSNSGAVYFGPTLSNPTGGIEASWDSANNRPAVTVGVIRDGNGSTGGGAKPKTSWRYDNTIRNYINNQEVYSVDANGINMPSGKGINFNVATGNVVASSGLLDDYEEGTFTPTIHSGVTNPVLSSATGANYTKVGRIVIFNMDIRVDSGTANSLDFIIGGLPFTNASLTANFGAGVITYGNIIVNQTNGQQGHISTNTNLMRFYDATTAITGTTSGFTWGVGRRMIITGMYLAA